MGLTSDLFDAGFEANKEITRLRAERDRYRDALREIAEEADSGADQPSTYKMECIVALALDALGEEE